jgi:hypothetical protein
MSALTTEQAIATFEKIWDEYASTPLLQVNDVVKVNGFIQSLPIDFGVTNLGQLKSTYFVAMGVVPKAKADQLSFLLNSAVTLHLKDNAPEELAVILPDLLKKLPEHEYEGLCAFVLGGEFSARLSKKNSEAYSYMVSEIYEHGKSDLFNCVTPSPQVKILTPSQSLNHLPPVIVYSKAGEIPVKRLANTAMFDSVAMREPMPINLITALPCTQETINHLGADATPAVLKILAELDFHFTAPEGGKLGNPAP